MRVYEGIEQGTPEWFALRAGKFTGSPIHNIVGESLETQKAITYIHEVAGGLITDVCEDEIDTYEMKWGRKYEPVAREMYSRDFGEQIKQVCFITPDHTNDYGFSPDGLIVGKEKGIEIKCPITVKNHVLNLTLRSQQELKKAWPKYYWQIQMALLVCDYEAWDFVSFHPYFKPKYMMVAMEVRPDATDIALLKKRLALAVEARDKILQKVKL